MNTIQFGRGRLVEKHGGNLYLSAPEISYGVMSNPAIQAALEAASDRVELRLYNAEKPGRGRGKVNCVDYDLIVGITGKRGEQNCVFNVNCWPVCPEDQRSAERLFTRQGQRQSAREQLERTIAVVAHKIADILNKLSLPVVESSPPADEIQLKL